MSLHPFSRFKLRGSQRWTWIALLSALIFITYLLLQQDHRSFVHFVQRYNFDNSNSNNETGAANGELIVPNIIHFVVLENPTINFIHFVCILAALKNHPSENIYFHTNVDSFKGKYWERLVSLKPFTDILVIKKIELPTEIFNQPIPPSMRIFHGGDVTRIRILMEYGGIYLDNDMYIVKNLDYYRKFEMAIGWDEGQFLGTQLIVAHKDARFLKLWLNTYDGAYDENRWYYNAGELPTTSVLYKHPELVHRVKVLFGNDNGFIYKLFQEYWPDWRNNYAFHLLSRHQYLLHNISKEAVYPVKFDEYNLQKYPITFREMANEALDFEKALRKSES